MFKLFTKRYQYFFPFLGIYQRQFFTLFAFIFLLAFSNTIMIWLLGLPFDHLVSQEYEALGWILSVLLVVILVNQWLHYIITYRANVVGLRYVGNLRSRLLKQFMMISPPVTQDVAKGDLLARLSHDVDKVQSFVIEQPFFLASHIFILLFYVSMLLYIDANLAILALILTPVIFVHQKFFSSKKRTAAKGFYFHNGKLLAQEDKTLENLLPVKGFNAEQRLHENHKNKFQQAFIWARRERKLDAGFTSTLAVVLYVCALIVVYKGVLHVQSGSLPVSALVSFLLYMGYLSVPVRGIANIFFQIQSDLMATDRVLYFFEKNISDDDLSKLNADKGQIDVKGLDFSFNEHKIFNAVNLTIRAGKTYAIVGKSGVGKSTFAKILLKLLIIDGGHIVIDGQELSQVSSRSVRNKITVVWQEPVIFDDTIRNNLILAQPSASDDDIIEALNKSDALEFVNKLPDRLNTLVGAAGVALSTGQKQRLQLAQAFLRDTPVLIMDEASSALDSMSEQKIVKNIRQMRSDKTTIIIAHRYSSIRFVDEVIYFGSNGNVTQGVHKDLVEHHAEYREAVKWQLAKE